MKIKQTVRIEPHDLDLNDAECIQLALSLRGKHIDAFEFPSDKKLGFDSNKVRNSLIYKYLRPWMYCGTKLVVKIKYY